MRLCSRRALALAFCLLALGAVCVKAADEATKEEFKAALADAEEAQEFREEAVEEVRSASLTCLLASIFQQKLVMMRA